MRTNFNDLINFIIEFDQFTEGGRWLSLAELSIAMLPEIFIFSGSLFLFLIWFKKVNINETEGLNKFLNYMLIGIVITFLLLYFNPFFPVRMGGFVQGNSISFQITYYTQTIKCFILLLFFIFLIGTRAYFNKIFFFSSNNNKTIKILNTTYSEYLTFLSLTVGFLFLLISVVNFLILILCLEAISFCLYVLIVFNKKSGYSIEAATKYFYYGAMTFGLYCVGMLFLYMSSGGLSFYNILEYGTGPGFYFKDLFNLNYPGHFDFHCDVPPLYIIGMLLIFSSLIFKLGGVPFHFWVADVYEGSAYPTTIFMGTVVKIGFCGILLKLCVWVFLSMIAYWQPLFLLTGSLSLIIGSIMAFKQKRIKRFFAYSSIVHVGFFLIGIGLIDFSNYPVSSFISNSGSIESNFTLLNSFTASLLYLGVYSLTVLLLFLVFLNLIVKKTGLPAIYFTELQGFLQKCRKDSSIMAFIQSIVVILLLFSMAGIPPFLGFFTKYFILMLAVKFKMYWLICIILSVTVLGAFYYLKIFKIFYFETGGDQEIVLLSFYNKTQSKKDFINIQDKGLNTKDTNYTELDSLTVILSIITLILVLIFPWTFMFETFMIVLGKSFLSVYWPELSLSFLDSKFLKYTVPYKLPITYTLILGQLMHVLEIGENFWIPVHTVEKQLNALLYEAMEEETLMLLRGVDYENVGYILHEFIENLYDAATNSALSGIDNLEQKYGISYDETPYDELPWGFKHDVTTMFFQDYYRINLDSQSKVLEDASTKYCWIMQDYLKGILLKEKTAYQDFLDNLNSIRVNENDSGSIK